MWVCLQLKAAGGVLRVSYCPPGNSWGITSPGRQVQCAGEASCAVASRQDRNFQFHRFQKPDLSEGLTQKEPTLIPAYPYTHSLLLLWFLKKLQRNCYRSSVSSEDSPNAQFLQTVLLNNWYLAALPTPLFLSTPPLFYFSLVINHFCSSLCIDHSENPWAFAK